MRAAARARALALALLAATRAAGANPADTFGLGSREAALGSAVAADCPSFAANYYNPAALVSVRNLDLSVGYMHASQRLRIDGVDNRLDSVHGLVGGLVAPGEAFGVPFAFGIATHLPDERLSRIRTLRQETPRWELYDNHAQLLYLATNLAIRPLKWLEVGGGVTYLAATSGTLDITGTADLANPESSQLRHEVDADLAPIRYPQAGVRVVASDDLAFGLVYRGQTKLKLALDANLHGQVAAVGGAVVFPAAYSLESRSLDAFLPQQVTLGASARVRRDLRVNLDLTWVNWSAYESPTSRSSAHFDVAVPAGLPVTIPPDPKPTAIVPPAFRDRLVPRVGVEWLVVRGESVEVPLRAGYVYERSPVPPQTGLTNFVDADRHAFSAGAGVKWNRPGAVLRGHLRLDVHAQVSVLPERRIEKTSPADFVGDYRAGGEIWAGGATLGVGF